jgi:hypothetical protein
MDLVDSKVKKSIQIASYYRMLRVSCSLKKLYKTKLPDLNRRNNLTQEISPKESIFTIRYIVLR